MIFQDPLTRLNPVLTIGRQIDRGDRRPTGRPAGEARKTRAVELLELVGIPDAGATARRLPAPVQRRHAPAGDDRHGAGLRARALLIADEPTTALDVTIQAQILELLRRLPTELGMADPDHHPRPGRRRRLAPTGSR